MGPVLLSPGTASCRRTPSRIEAGCAFPNSRASCPRSADPGAIAEAARLLADAQAPVILADRMARTPAAMARLVELAESLQCPVIDEGGRMNFPSRHR